MTAIPGYHSVQFIDEDGTFLRHSAVRDADDRAVILKQLIPGAASPGNISLIRREYDVLSRLNAASVVNALELNDLDGSLTLVTEQAEGMSLEWIMNRGPLGPVDTMHLGIAIAGALNQIHGQNIIHSNLNPEAIICTPELRRVKLTGFDYAFLRTSFSTFSGDRLIEGRVEYHAPEQSGRMNRTTDYRADFYSLGVILYRLLSGRLPFSSDDLLQLIHQHLTRMPPELDESALPVPVVRVVMKLLEKMPEDRYQSAFALQRDLESCLELQQTDAHQAGSFEPGLDDLPEQLNLPERLYDRQRQSETLVKARQDIENQASRTVVVMGAKGTGKSALLQEFRKELLRQPGYSVFSQQNVTNADMPLSAIGGTINELGRQLVASPDFFEIREELRNELGAASEAITRLAPTFRTILGPDDNNRPSESMPRLESMPLTEAILSLLKVLGKRDRSLVFCIDNLQWVDLKSLELLDNLLTEGVLKGVLFILAYRSAEIAPADQRAAAIAAFWGRHPAIISLRLSNLSQPVVASLLSDTLYQSPVEVMPLAKLVFEKTGGNPLAVREFITALYENNALAFDRRHRDWIWDLERAESLPPTVNVGENLAKRLQQLDPAVADLLMVAACLGDRFDTETLRRVADRTLSDINGLLVAAMRDGFLLPETPSGNTYRFSHERIQLTAHSLLDELRRQEIHARIGQVYLGATKQETNTPLSDHLLEAVDHLNSSVGIAREVGAGIPVAGIPVAGIPVAGIPVAGTPVADLTSDSPLGTATGNAAEGADIARLAALNLQAAERARQQHNLAETFRYQLNATTLLGQTGWDHQPELCLRAHLAAAETAYLNGDQSALEHLTSTALAHLEHQPDRARVQKLQMMANIAAGNFEQAIIIGTSALESLSVTGITAPGYLNLKIRALVLAFRGWLHQPRSAPDDTSHETTSGILELLWEAGSRSGDPRTEGFAVLLAERAVSLDHVSATTAVIARALIIQQCGFRALREEESWEILLKDSTADSRALEQELIAPWNTPVDQSMDILQTAAQEAMRAGDVEAGLKASMVRFNLALIQGSSLADLGNELTTFNQLAGMYHQTSLQQQGLLYQQVVENLIEVTDAPFRLAGNSFNEAAMQDTACNLHAETNLARLWLAELFGEHQQALKFADAVRARLRGLRSAAQYRDFILFESVAILNATPLTRGYRRRLRDNRTLLKRWVAVSAENHLDAHHLMEAEIARQQEKPDEASGHYELAINHAERHHHRRLLAFSCERMGALLNAVGKMEMAAFYFSRARESYLAWGAVNKVQALEREHPELTAQTFNATSGYPGDTPHAPLPTSLLLDLNSVIQASQVLSGEVVQDSLLEKLMSLALENAGADHAGLVLMTEGALTIEAISRVEGSNIVHDLQRRPLTDSRLLPASIIRVVASTREDMVLNNAPSEDFFTRDKYLTHHAPQSILCIGILSKAALTGVLYLENRRTRQAFSQERITVLRVLASQAAIAIENAKLYQSVDDSRNRYLSLYENAVEGIFEIDPAGEILNLNPAARHLFGIEPEGPVSVDLTTLFIDDGVYEELQARLNKEKQTIGFETHMRRLDGEEIWVSISSRLVEDETGRPVLLEGSIIDITETRRRQQAEEEKRLAQAAADTKSQFLANMSHEIRTPMNAIMGYTELALKSDLDERQSGYLTTIRNSSQHLLRVVNDILDISRVESGKLELKYLPFNLADIFRDIDNLFALQAQQKGLQLILPTSESVTAASYRGDPVRIGQVLINLVSNAIKFTPTGEVEISCHVTDEDEATSRFDFSVRDTGIGIPEEQRERIFESFAQTDESHADSGTGLGLAICRRLVGMMGGEIHVTNEASGGSRFHFHILVSRADAVSMDTQTPPEQPGLPQQGLPQPTTRLLLAEDNPINQSLAVEVLEASGFEVVVANDGKQALQLLEQQPVSAVLMDLRMPEMDGYEALREIRRNPAHASLPVVALSASVLPQEIESALARGFDRYVTKPVDFTELQTVLAELIDDKREKKIPDRSSELNIEVARQNHNHNDQLLTRLMQQFIDLYSSAGDELERLLSDGEAESAERLCHNLAGVAGSFGAPDLMEAARSTEQCLIAGNPVNEAMIGEVRDQLRDCLIGMSAFLQNPANTNPTTSSWDDDC